MDETEDSNASPSAGATTGTGKGATGVGRGKAAPDAAFDIWLQRGLHALFDPVMREPIPDELLKLIEGDKKE